MDRNRPLLLVDIDGVISLFGFDHARAPEGRFVAVDGILHYLSASAGGHLRRLGEHFELAWCSGWEEKANEHLPLALDLPGPFPYVPLDGPRLTQAHWKLASIDTFAGAQRPVAWIDDAHDPDTEAWAHRRPGPTLLVRTAPPIGLTEADVRVLADWARKL